MPVVQVGPEVTAQLLERCGAWGWLLVKDISCKRELFACFSMAARTRRSRASYWVNKQGSKRCLLMYVCIFTHGLSSWLLSNAEQPEDLTSPGDASWSQVRAVLSQYHHRASYKATKVRRCWMEVG